MVVRAAGGIVVRSGPEGLPEILLVHRPRYDDWTLPKGKAEPGESDEDCALREVEEETRLACELGNEVAVSAYTDASGRPKRVRYFQMTAPAVAEAAPQNEVDAVRWLDWESALDALTYGRDRDVLSEAMARG